MSRITHIDGTPTQQRNAIRRTIAEILRRLMDKKTIDDETQDMLAFIQATQPQAWEYLAKLQKGKAEETLLDDLCRALNSPH